MLFTFLYYMLVGLVLNWGCLFVVYGILMHICGDNYMLYQEIFNKYQKYRIGFDMSEYPNWMPTLVTQLLWPLNVYNTFRCGIPAIMEAKRRIQNGSK